MSEYDYFAISRMVNHMQEMQSKMLSHTSRLRRKSAKSRDEADSELRLYLAAMINILISKNIISQEDFGQVVAAIDGLDGEIDGKLSGEFKGDGSVEAYEGGVEGRALAELAKAVKKM